MSFYKELFTKFSLKGNLSVRAVTPVMFNKDEILGFSWSYEWALCGHQFHRIIKYAVFSDQVFILVWILPAALLKNHTFWDVTPCWLVNI